MSHAAVVALVPAPGELVSERLTVTPGWLVVASAHGAEAICPACECASRRCTRRLAGGAP